MLNSSDSLDFKTFRNAVFDPIQHNLFVYVKKAMTNIINKCINGQVPPDLVRGNAPDPREIESSQPQHDPGTVPHHRHIPLFPCKQEIITVDVVAVCKLLDREFDGYTFNYFRTKHPHTIIYLQLDESKYFPDKYK